MKLSWNKVINIMFWNYFHHLSRHYDLILCNFPKSYTSVTMLATVFVHIIGKLTPSSKRWLIFEMDIAVPHWRNSDLSNTKIPQKSGKSGYLMGGPKILIFEKWLIHYKKVITMSKLVKFHQNICIFEDFTVIFVFVSFIGISPEIKIR